jgi:hypothetical protein
MLNAISRYIYHILIEEWIKYIKQKPVQTVARLEVAYTAMKSRHEVSIRTMIMKICDNRFKPQVISK